MPDYSSNVSNRHKCSCGATRCVDKRGNANEVWIDIQTDRHHVKFLQCDVWMFISRKACRFREITLFDISPSNWEF